MNFEYREKENNSFELFNTEYNDIYFSNVGAHKEALEKFVLPTEPENFSNKKIKILDVCYGMGFNSKAFVDYAIKNNLNISFDIDCIEVDKNILALGLFIFDDNISKEVINFFNKSLFLQIDLSDEIKNISKEEWFLNILKHNSFKNEAFNEDNGGYFTKGMNLTTFLHNIYYQNHEVFKNKANFLKINYILNKLELVLPNLKTGYDLIFHDAFSILKQPSLWSEDIMRGYYSILNQNGKLLTYSNSRVLRRTLEKVGFEVIVNTIGNRKQNGTIACKN